MRILKKELWPYKVTVNSGLENDIDPIEEWLGANMGDQWNVVYHYNSTDFYFRSEQDAVFFTLRWK